MNRQTPEGHRADAGRVSPTAADGKPNARRSRRRPAKSTAESTLAQATSLYDEYLELSKLGQVVVSGEEESSAQAWIHVAPAPDRTVGLMFGAMPLGLVIRTNG